jgi:TolB-like protein
VQRVVRGKLPVQMLSIGRRNLKNMAEAVEAFAIDLEGAIVPATAVQPLPEARPQDSLRGTSVVILPLKNLSGDPSDIHLCDGITSDLITNLSRFRDLLVIARHSAFYFRDTAQSLREVGHQLDARYALTGGLQRAGHRLSISVQLSDTESGGVIWSDRYRGDLRDIFDFQEDITGIIASQLSIQIAEAERRRLRSLPPSNLRAYGLILRGHDLALQHRRDTNLHARRLFEEAAELDPRFGRSFAGMSRTYNLAWRYRWADSPEISLDTAVELAVEAIKRDNLDARGHSELGFACLYKKQHEASIAAYERAVELNPNDADILADMGDSLTSSGFPERAIEAIRRAMRLNPLHPDSYLWHLGEAYFDLSRYVDAIPVLKKMRDQSQAHRLLAASHALLGEMTEARYHAAQVLAVHPDFSLEHWSTVPPNKNREPLERFIEGLRAAGLR